MSEGRNDAQLAQLTRMWGKMRVNERKVKQQAFLDAYGKCTSVSSAAESSGVSRRTVYDWAERFPDFKQKFDEATEAANDRIDDEIMRRGVTGWEEPIASAGKQVFTRDGQPLMIRRYSDTLMVMLAKSRMQKYREKQQMEHSGSIDINGARETLLRKLAGQAQQESKQE